MKFKNWWAGLAGLLYDYSKYKEEKRDKRAQMLADAQKANAQNQEGLNKAQTVYNYNYLDDSNTGNTLFDSQKKTKRTIFGNEGVM